MRRADRLIGRDEELARIRTAIARARLGSGSVVLVVGPAGIGKSALVRHSVGRDPAAVVGRASPPPSPTAQALVEFALAMVRRGGDPRAEALAVHRGALRVLLPGSGPAAGEMEPPTPMHLVDALLELRATLDRRRPGMLVLEDLHWADEVTLNAVDYLADRVQGTAILIIATTRPTEPTVALAQRIAARHAGEVLRLDGLAPSEAAAVAEECLGEQLPPTLLDALGAAEGVPLQIEELLFAYEHTGALALGKVGWRFDPSPGEVPVSVAESTSGRMASLPPGELPPVQRTRVMLQVVDR